MAQRGTRGSERMLEYPALMLVGVVSSSQQDVGAPSAHARQRCLLHGRICWSTRMIPQHAPGSSMALYHRHLE
jgi:hypothetical protein